MSAADPPAPSSAILYVDTSALLKLLVREAESAAIERELLRWTELATSVITEVELPRAVARAREERAAAVIDGSVVLQGVLSSAAIVPLNERSSLKRATSSKYTSAHSTRSMSQARSASASSLRAWPPTTSACRTPSGTSGSV